MSKVGKGVAGLYFGKVTAGWIVKRYNPSMDETDILAGAFATVQEAVDAGRKILLAELATAESELAADPIVA